MTAHDVVRVDGIEMNWLGLVVILLVRLVMVVLSVVDYLVVWNYRIGVEWWHDVCAIGVVLLCVCAHRLGVVQNRDGCLMMFLVLILKVVVSVPVL